MAEPDKPGEFPGELVVVDRVSWIWVGDKWREVGVPIRTPDDVAPFRLIDEIPPDAV